MEKFKRKLFYLGGFDPRGVRFYHQLCREQAERHGALTGQSLDVSGRRAGPAGSTVSTQWQIDNPGARVETDYEFLRWEDLVGKVWQVELPNGSSAVETLREDGTVKITGGLSDRGYWRIWEQGYCTQWFRMRNGAERCFTLDRTADGKIRVFKPDGEISMTILSTEPIKELFA